MGFWKELLKQSAEINARKIDKKSSQKLKDHRKNDKYISSDEKIRIDKDFKSAWIDPDKLDFDGDIKAISPNKKYYFVEGAYKKGGKDYELIDGIALITIDEKIFHKPFDESIDKSIVSNNGSIIFYSANYDLYCFDISGKQIFKKQVGIPFDEEKSVLSERVCCFYGDNRDSEVTLWVIDVINSKHWSKKFNHKLSKYDRVVIENNTIALILPDGKKVFDITGKGIE